MTQPVELVGGAFDGMQFLPLDNWEIPPAIQALYLWRKPPSLLDVQESRSLPWAGGILGTTTDKNVVFMAREAYQGALYEMEAYVRCNDGKWRTPPLVLPTGA